MTGTRTLRRGEAVEVASLSGGGRRGAGPLEIRVSSDGAPPDLVVLLLGADGRVHSDRDLVFFNEPTSIDGSVSIAGVSAGARIDTAAVEQRVARVLVACAGGALDSRWASSLRVDITHPGQGVLASALIDVPAAHRAENLLEVYRHGDGWRLRVLGDGYASGLEGLVRDHGVHVEDPAPAQVLPPVAPRHVAPAWAAAPPPPPAPVPQRVPSPPTAHATRSRGRRRVLVFGGAGVAALLAAVVGVSLAGGSDPAPRAAAPTAPLAATSSAPTVAAPTSSAVLTPAVAAVVPVASAAQVELAALPVKGRAPMTGYDRAQFGQAWADVDRNGCDTRNDVLRRDVTAAVVDPRTHGCVVLSGVVADPYNGRSIPFHRGDTAGTAVQIDHVVALGDAWQTGAQQLDPTRRLQFANDPANLLAVDGSLNAQKGDGDAATWLPPNTAFRCTYVAMQVAVKREYGLWVTPAERDAIARVLGGCPGATAPPAPTPVAPTTTSAPPLPPLPPTGDPSGVYYANCTAARAAGAAPILRGEPGYRPGLDRDGDGIACE